MGRWGGRGPLEQMAFIPQEEKGKTDETAEHENNTKPHGREIGKTLRESRLMVLFMNISYL